MATVGPGTLANKAKLGAKPGAKLTAKGDHFKRLESTVDNLDYLVGQKIWIKVDTEELFALVTVQSFTANDVSVTYNGETITVPRQDCLNADIINDAMQVHDLVKLPHANSAVVLDILRTRFMADCIYAYAGKLLIVLNPFKLIPNLYGPVCIERYRKAETTLGFPTDLPPHTYAVAQCAVNGLHRDDACQSCIVSGESGAGKTETAKQLMNFFAYGPGNKGDNVQSVIMGSNVILEAFGNAKTLRNNNSSRFGKFIKILVAREGGLKGGIISSYMLELSRIEFQSENERNYHIFYQCLKGLPQSERDTYGFLEMNQYKFLNRWNCYDAPGIDDVKDFAEVKRELQMLFSESEYADFMRCIAGILLCGNIEFKEVAAMGVDNAASISNQDDFNKLCAALGVDGEKAAQALTTKVVTIQGKTIESAVTIAAAEVNVRALAKDLYGSLFEFCIDKINSIITFDDQACKWIGILDIYGFEYFQRNTYEQLLINYANERLQQYFINRVFASEIAEYDAEGIDHSSITYTDNSNVLLIFDKPNCSIFSFLEEQCLIQTGSSESFTASCKGKIKNELFVPANGNICRFTVVHTATSVTYDTDEFVVKNKHKLSVLIVELLHASKNVIVNQASQKIPVEVGNMKGKFLGSKFQASIGALMKTLHMTESHFIRCIKTNQQKQALLFETKNVYGQLISLSIVEAIQTIHRGYAYRASFEKFIKDNEFISSFLGSDPNIGGDMKQSIQGIMQSFCIPQEAYQIGHSKVFLKKSGWMLLEKVFLQYTKASKPLGEALCGVYRVWKNRGHLLSSRETVIRIQANIRRYHVQMATLIIQENIRKLVGLVLTLDLIVNEDPRVQAATLIQSWCRMRLCRKQYMKLLEEERKRQRIEKARANLKRVAVICNVIGTTSFLWRLQEGKAEERAATKIASSWRMHVAIRRLNNLKLRKILGFAATFIQKHVRGYLQRQKYRYIKTVLPHVIRLQAAFRSCLAVRHLDPDMREGVNVIRRHMYVTRTICFTQAVVRCLLSHKRISDAQNAVLCLQKFAWSRSCNEEIIRVRHSTDTIRQFLRNHNQQSALRIERGKILQEAEKQLCERLTSEETKAAHGILEKYRGAVNRRFVPVHFNVYSDHRPVYGEGWCYSLEALLLASSGHTNEITGVGAENTKSIVVLGGTHVYAFGQRQGNQHRKDAAARMPWLINTVSAPLQVTSVHCGADHSLLLLSDKSIYGFGSNVHGQCGVGQRTALVTSPALVRIHDIKGEPLRVKSVSAGNYHSCAVGEDGEVMVWGKSEDLNLPSFHEDVIFPVQMNMSWLSIEDKVEETFCGNRVSYLVTKLGRLYSFGGTYNGQLGHEFVQCAYPRAVGIPGRVMSVGCGKNHTLVADESFEIYIFGTSLAIKGSRQVKEQFMTPQRLQFNRAAMKSPVIKCSAGVWESNVLTEDCLVWAWSYLLVDGDVKRPIVYKYTCLSNLSTNDLLTVSSQNMAITFVGV